MSATQDPTARDILKGFLHPAMDARAHNAEQDRLIYNPSQECDSLVEHLVRIRPYLPVADYSVLLTLIRGVLESNAAEGEHERAIARFADQMSASKRRQEAGPGFHKGSRA